VLILSENEEVKRMRENKYRAFDRKTGDMFPVHEMQWNDKGELIFFKGRYDYEKDLYTVGGGNPNKMTGTANHLDGLVKRFEIMQYTGLKDKNNKEIYEGDFVHIHIPIIGSEVTDFFGAVKFYEGAFLVDDNEDAIPLWSEINIPFIVGNIYENPELLGGAQ